jgi:nucleotide-binding universal stress UspA family protein
VRGTVFSNILVALDGSEISQRALIEAVDQAKVWNAKIQAIYVMETPRFALDPMNQTMGMDNSLEMYRLLEKQGEEVLNEAKKYGADKGITIITHLRQGDAGVEILSLSEQNKCDLIVVASHSKSNIDRLLLGSVSSFVVTHNKVKTLVVRE